MKILFVHTLYGQSGGEDEVFKNETALLSSIADVQSLYFNNGGNSLSILLKFILAPCNIFALIKFNKILSNEKPDLIHFHNWYFAASPLLIRAAKRKGIPVVVTLHNYRLLCPSATLFHNGGLFTESLIGGFPWKAVFKKVYRESRIQTFWLAFTIHCHKWLKTWQNVDRYITLTPFAKQLFLESNLNLKEHQFAVKSNFTDDHGFCIDNRQDFFLYAGRLSPEKGINILLDSFIGTPHKLIIIGDGPLRPDIEKAAINNHNVVYIGKRSNAEIIQFMKQASALVFPSIWYEGMPMTILEAFSTGTPVIASKLGAMESLIDHGINGILFKPSDLEDFRKALDDWQKLDAVHKRVIAQNSRKSYENYYTKENNLRQTISIYNSLISKITTPMETLKSIPEINVLKFPVFNSTLQNMELNGKAVINTLNQYSYVMTTKDLIFKEALLASDVLLPDGIGIVAACRMLTGSKIKKIAGMDLHKFLLEKLNSSGGGCFYLGSSSITLEKIKANLNRDYQTVKVGYYAPPYKQEFDDIDNKRMIEAINSFDPDVLFIGLSAPKQEKWVYLHKHELNVKTICSIGAVFEFYAGTINRPSKFWINMGMEWFIRLIYEPGRLWKRYLYYGPLFMYLLIKEKFKKSVI